MISKHSKHLKEKLFVDLNIIFHENNNNNEIKSDKNNNNNEIKSDETNNNNEIKSDETNIDENIDEEKILLEIKELNNNSLLFLNNIKNIIENITNKINNLNNNYFLKNENILEYFYNIYNVNLINNFKKKLDLHNNYLEQNLENICQHNWIEDYIDLDLYKTIKINYCDKCECSLYPLHP